MEEILITTEQYGTFEDDHYTQVPQSTRSCYEANEEVSRNWEFRQDSDKRNHQIQNNIDYLWRNVSSFGGEETLKRNHEVKLKNNLVETKKFITLLQKINEKSIRKDTKETIVKKQHLVDLRIEALEAVVPNEPIIALRKKYHYDEAWGK